MWIMPGVLVFWVLSNLWKVTTQSKCVFLPLEAFSDVTILCINRLIQSYLLIFTFFFFSNTIWKQDLNWFPFLTFHISLAVRPRTSHCRVPQFLSCKVGGRPCLVRRAVTCSWPLHPSVAEVAASVILLKWSARLGAARRTAWYHWLVLVTHQTAVTRVDICFMKCTTSVHFHREKHRFVSSLCLRESSNLFWS